MARRNGSCRCNVNRLVNGKIPKVYFLTGDLERDVNKMGDREYKAVTTLTTFRYSLMNQGFDVDTVSMIPVKYLPIFLFL